MSQTNPVNDRTPLLSTNQNGHAPTSHLRSSSSSHLITDSSPPENEPSPNWVASFRYFFFGSWFNVLLVFIPLSFLSHWLNWDAALRFSFSFLAIIPLAKLLGDATDQISLKLNQTISGLLNASFGNAVEIIVGVAALLRGELRIVQTSMIGSILSNLLLVLGCSFFAGGLLYNESFFQKTAAQAQSSLLLLACITLVIPAAYRSTFDKSANNHKLTFPFVTVLNSTDIPEAPVEDAESGLLIFSRGTAILLLLVYCAYLYFELRSHAYLFEDKVREVNENDPVPPPVIVEEAPKMNAYAAGMGLLLATLVTSFCADYLVASIEETAERYEIPRPFIGTILLPIVGNAAEHVTSVWMARKDKMELTIGVCVGSSIQIATFVIPLLVIIGWITNHPLTLFFENFETIVLFVSVLMVNLLIMDGKSNYMEGVLLIMLYLVIAIAFWVT